MADTEVKIPGLVAGEWSAFMSGRDDLQGYTASGSVMENMIPAVQGPGKKRGGERFVAEARDAATRSWFVPFVRSRSIAYVVEFSGNRCRFFANRAQVLDGTYSQAITGVSRGTTTTITVTGHGLSTGDRVILLGIGGTVELNGRAFDAVVVNTNTIRIRNAYGDEIDSSGYGAFTSGGLVRRPLEIASPYTAADLVTAQGEFGLDVAQTGDVLFIARRDGAGKLQKLSRTGVDTFSFAEVDPDTGPFLRENGTDTTVHASAATGVVTLTASASIFTAGHVGALFRLDQQVIEDTPNWEASTVYPAGTYVRSEGKEYVANYTGANRRTGTTIPSHTFGTVDDGNGDVDTPNGIPWEYVSAGYGVLRITSVTSGTQATATVIRTLPQTVLGADNASALWRFGAWSEASGYPVAVAFHNERLACARRLAVDFSVTSAFEDFSPDDAGEILPENAVSVDVPGGKANEVQQLVDGDALVVHTEGSEIIIDKVTTSDPFGPGNVSPVVQGRTGARPIEAFRIGESILFVQSSGQRLRELAYSIEVDNLQPNDMTVRAEHVLRPRAISMTRQEERDSQFWIPRSDGVLCSFAYEPTQDVRGWARHTLSGVVEHVATIPSPDGALDDVWVSVRRTVRGQTTRQIGYLTRPFDETDAIEDAVAVDASLTYEGAPATVIHGLDHLEGEQVVALAGGVKVSGLTVQNAAITLPAAASPVHIGKAIRSRWQSQRLTTMTRAGSTMGKPMTVKRVVFRMVRSLGGKAGPSFDRLSPIPGLNKRPVSAPMSGPIPLVTDDVEIDWDGDWDLRQNLCFEHDDPFPFAIASALAEIDLGSRT